MAARQVRFARDYRRRDPVREPYDVVLIVCEGTKTEPRYFKEFCVAHMLSSANVTVVPSRYGNDPLSVVNYAEDQLNGSADYDRVYCVFDRNGHSTYNAALQKVRDSEHGKTGRLIAIPSVPCFEVWVLLHYGYTTAPFNAVGKKSACDHVVSRVTDNFGKYRKGFAGVYQELESRLDKALTHAHRLEEHNKTTNSENPATAIHHLVDYMRRLRQS